MTVEIRIVGAEHLDALAKRLRAVGEAGIRKQLIASIKTATKPVEAEVKANVRARLPKRGGLADTMGKLRVSTQVRSAGQKAGVRIAGSSGHNLRQLNRGIVAHPVYGHRDQWVKQAVPAKTFDEPIERSAPRIRAEILKGIDQIAAIIERG